jgi:hypothetical protein
MLWHLAHPTKLTPYSSLNPATPTTPNHTRTPIPPSCDKNISLVSSWSNQHWYVFRSSFPRVIHCQQSSNIKVRNWKFIVLAAYWMKLNGCHAVMEWGSWVAQKRNQLSELKMSDHSVWQIGKIWLVWGVFGKINVCDRFMTHWNADLFADIIGIQCHCAGGLCEDRVIKL